MVKMTNPNIRQRRKLRIMQNQDYGFAESGIIGVNIEKIWLETGNEDMFIAEFASTYAHELLHILLAGLNLPDLVEEEVIRAILGEKWNAEIEAAYE